MKNEIPIFFAADNNYLPILDVALRSLIDNASKDFNYVINVINTGLDQKRCNVIKQLENENFTINFCDISSSVDKIKQKLKNIYHFSISTWYRLFIQSLFPQYDKALYLDCDLIVLGDISKLYNQDIGNNLLGAARCHIVSENDIFSQYAESFCGVSRKNYLQAGVLVMNLAEFRRVNLEDKFIYLLNKYDFDVIDPDQGYLNAMCNGRVKIIDNGWNKEAIPAPLEGELNIVHYALYKKPWQYDDVLYQEYFWKYAKDSPFYNEILQMRTTFTDEMRNIKEKANSEIVEHAKRCLKNTNSFVNLVINGNPDWFRKLKINDA